MHALHELMGLLHTKKTLATFNIQERKRIELYLAMMLEQNFSLTLTDDSNGVNVYFCDGKIAISRSFQQIIHGN